MLGPVSPSPLPAQRAEFWLCPLPKPPANLLCYLRGGCSTCPHHRGGRPWAGQSRLRCGPAGDGRHGDITRVASAPSLFQRTPRASHNLAFPISVISSGGKTAAPPAFRREGRVGKEKPEETRLLRRFASPSPGVPPLLSRTDLRLPKPSSAQQSYVGLIKTTLTPL